MIKAFVADDEPLARDELIFLLRQEDNIQVVGEAANGEEALTKILSSNPDVVFLDIRMPKMDGLTVAKKLLEHNKKFNIVFATAYDQHAIQAFEINAVDYLLKPFDEGRVNITLERIKEKVESPDKQVIFKVLQELKEEAATSRYQAAKLAIQGDKGLIFLDPKDIVYFFHSGRDVFVKTCKNEFRTNYTLQVLEEKLAYYPFFRTHKSFLVNLNYASELIPWFNGAYELVLNDGKRTKVPVSRTYVKDLKDVLQL